MRSLSRCFPPLPPPPSLSPCCANIFTFTCFCFHLPPPAVNNCRVITWQTTFRCCKVPLHRIGKRGGSGGGGNGGGPAIQPPLPASQGQGGGGRGTGKVVMAFGLILFSIHRKPTEPPRNEQNGERSSRAKEPPTRWYLWPVSV